MDIIAKTTNNDISVQSINIIKSNDAFMYEITVLVSDKDKLTKFMNDVDSIPKILDVERAIK
jgi:(p)ppGpp synthase/HD superfamily hydrolase